jgi:hypothetical protein
MTEAIGKSGARPEKEARPAENKPAFPHQQYLEKRDGQPYLPLKWRLAWLRFDHPQAKILTRLASHEGQVAVFVAEVQLPEGGGATGWGAKSQQEPPTGHFESDSLDYLIAAENQALSRALAALGYGTEYALDFDPPAEKQAIPLPEGLHYEPAQDEEEKGIEVPMVDEPTPIRRAAPVIEQTGPADREDESDYVDEDEGEGEESDEDENEADFPGKPLPVTPPKGEVRSLFEKRPPANISQVRETAERRPLRMSEAAPEPVEGPPGFGTARPIKPFTEPAPVQAAPTAAPGNAAVDERLKNVRDEGLRIQIKRIYYEARQRFKYDEDRVDARSRDLYKKPAFELDAEQAENYYERIVTAPIPKRR